MREAEAALAHTESVLKTRKEALMAKHVDGRESLNEIDYIFRRREEQMEEQKANSNFNLLGENYLDTAGREHDAEAKNFANDDSPDLSRA